MYVWSITAVNKAYKLFEVKYCETIVEEACSQLETKVKFLGPKITCIDKYSFSLLVNFRGYSPVNVLMGMSSSAL